MSEIPSVNSYPPMPPVKPPADEWRPWNYNEVPRDTILEGLWKGPILGYPDRRTQLKGWVKDDFYVQSYDDEAYSCCNFYLRLIAGGVTADYNTTYPDYWRPQQGVPRDV